MMRCEFNIDGQCIHDTGIERVACGTCPYSFEEGACRCAMFAPHEPNSKLSYIEKRASWDDVAAKGRAIVATDGVEIIKDDAQEVEAWVMSGQLEGELNDLGRPIDITDGGPYDVILSKKSWQNKSNVGGWIQGFLCDCVWGSYHSGSPGDSPNWVRFCSHAYALMLYKNMRARKDFFGASIIDRENFIKNACAGKNVGSVEDKGNYQIVRDGDKVAIRIKRASADCYINGLLGFSIDTGDEVKVNILAWYPDDDGEMHIKAYADSGEFGGFYDVDGIHYVGDGYGYSVESALEAALWRCGVELDERIERIVDMIDDSLWGQLVAKRKRAFTQPKILDPSSNAYTALEEVCRVLSMRYPECEFAIENIYFDYGQDWWWTNIVCYKPDGHSFQVLNPREFEILVETYSVDYVVRLIETDKYWPLRAKGASVKMASCDFEDGVYGQCTESGNQVKATVLVWDKYTDDDVYGEYGEYTVVIRYEDSDYGDGYYYEGDGVSTNSLVDAFDTACWQASFELAQDIYEYCDFVENWLRGNVASVASRKTAAITLNDFEPIEPTFMSPGIIMYRYVFNIHEGSYTNPILEIYCDWEDGDGDRWSWSLGCGFDTIMSCYDKWMFDSPEAALDDFLYGENVSFIRDGYVNLIDKVYDKAYTASRVAAEPYDYSHEFNIGDTFMMYSDPYLLGGEYNGEYRIIDKKEMSSRDSSGAYGVSFKYRIEDTVTGECFWISDSDLVDKAVFDTYQGDWYTPHYEYASNKNATRHFTYAEMQELDDEIEGRELHNSSRLRYTTGTELM